MIFYEIKNWFMYNPSREQVDPVLYSIIGELKQIHKNEPYNNLTQQTAINSQSVWRTQSLKDRAQNQFSQTLEKV